MRIRNQIPNASELLSGRPHEPARRRTCTRTADPAAPRTLRGAIFVEEGRMRPSWDTTDTSGRVDFLHPGSLRASQPHLWAFACDRLDIPSFCDIWIQNGAAQTIGMVHAHPLTREGICAETRAGATYRDVRPGEAVRVLTVDTLTAPPAPPPLWIEIGDAFGRITCLAIGPGGWSIYPSILVPDHAEVR